MEPNPIGKVAWILVLIGGFNWGLVGWWKYNLVDKIFGVESTGSRVIYALVGVATLYCIYEMYKMIGKKTAKK